jgi:signal transduction histidine kinase
MNPGLTDLRQLEQRMTRIRLAAILFGAIAIPIQSRYPDTETQVAALTTIGVLALGTVIIWGASGRVGTLRDHRKISLWGFIFDSIVIMGLVWIFSFETNWVSWALLLVIPLEGALRYRSMGAAASAAAIAAFFLVETLHRSEITGEPFDSPMYIFVVSLTLLIAGVVGSMAEQWHMQSVAFEQQSLKLAEADKLKDRFLAITSHEIRGPLTAIIGGVDTVKTRFDRLTADQRDRLLEMVSLQGHQLARMVDDLLITSQLQAGQLALHTAPANLDTTVSQALEAAASKRRNHLLEVFVEPLNCDIDAGRVEQIIRNLVENAYKYTPEGTRVSVEAKATTDGIAIAIADEGPGIPADKREELFEAFSRISETSAGQEGVGLGLYVVSQLVSGMRGHIDLKSSSKGTTFTISIPCATRPARQRHLGLVEGGPGSAEA